jgi:Skp family chaperone for outer membrane proteins
VTNDSIQGTEFKFLQLLKDKAKPLIVLLNVKNNLRDSQRLEYFLKDPDKLFAMEGKSGLGGHIERIHCYAKKHYANDYFDVVPALLLAAQMSREPEHKERKDKLFKASRMQAFLDSIRVSLVEHGVIRRSQTLLGSTVGAIDRPYKWVTEQAQTYEQLTDTLKNKRETIQKSIKGASQDNRESLQQEIEAIFQDALNKIPSFAEDHWNSNEISMKLGWEQKLKSIHFEERLNNAYQEASQKFNKDVQGALEEIGNELQLMAKLGGFSFRLSEQDSSAFVQNLLRFGGQILSIIGLFIPPIRVLSVIAGGIFNGLAGLFKSKEQKRREAVQNISVSLIEQLNHHKHTTLQQAVSNFNKYCSDVSTNINTYFEELIAGLNAISVQLEAAKSKFSGTANYLNRAYAKRIIDWCLEQHEPLTDEGINRTVAKVERDFGRSMNIQTKSNFQLRKSQDDIKRVLQEDVSIQSIKY